MLFRSLAVVRERLSEPYAAPWYRNGSWVLLEGLATIEADSEAGLFVKALESAPPKEP